MLRGKRLSYILLILLLTVAVIAFCACGEASKPDSGGEEPPATDVQEPPADADSPVGSEEPDDQEPVDTEEPPADDPVEEPKKDPVTSSGGDDFFVPTEGMLPWEEQDVTKMPQLIDRLDSDPDDLFILINKVHAVSKSYKPTGMVTMKNSLTTWENLELKADAYDAYLEMYDDAKAQGFDLKVCSAYRTYTTQEGLYNNSMANRGQETTYLRSAKAGRSEHHTGYAIDITSASMGWGLKQDFADYEDGKWINDHCHEYGYIIRYPKGKTEITGYAYEPWHLRYVGVEAATYIMENDLTLEEYLGR